MIKKADVIIAILVLLISFTGYIVTGASISGQAKCVIIESEGEIFAEYSMDQTRIVDVKGHNKVEITPDYVRVIYADCPDKTDVKQGKITSPGSMIICMPNQLVIRIVGEAEYDAISY